MRKMLFIAALLVTTTAAHAGDSVSFQINGQRVRIDRPRNCNSLSCINISAPGLINNSKDEDGDTAPAPSSNAAAVSTRPQGSQQASVAASPAQTPSLAPVQPSVPAQSQAPIPAPPAGPAAVGTVPPLPQANAAASSSITTLPAPAADSPAQQSAPAPVQNQVVASAPAQQQPLAQAAVTPEAPDGPMGVWMTEKNEGKVHVVACGTNICGYAVDKKTGADGEKVLINMRPNNAGTSWSGRIHDTRGGGTYDSTIAMRGNDKMRVQGCAFGGMFCGGQTWSRVN